MAYYVNEANLVGNLGRDPEVRTFQNGRKQLTLSIATAESWRDKTSGEWKERTEWHNVVINDERAPSITSKRPLPRAARSTSGGPSGIRKFLHCRRRPRGQRGHGL
jgi:hypothetical protein